MTEPQNIYDDPAFFEGYEHLRRTRTGLNEVLEQPAFRLLLPSNLTGLRVLDLGCGFGDFARFACALGARAVVGIDVSANMLSAAEELTEDPSIAYRRIAIEDFEAEGEPFDLVVSSLALHYVEDYVGAVRRIVAGLRKGGAFVFSVEHPICTALAHPWIRDAEGKALYWPVDDYRREGPRDTRWFVDGVVKYHRTVETYVNGLLDAGFVLKRLLEPEPATADAAIPELGLHRRRPPFLLISAER